MATVETYVSVDVDLDDFDDYDLIEELEKRGKGFEVAGETPTELVRTIYEKRRLGKDYQTDLDELIYIALGRI